MKIQPLQLAVIKEPDKLKKGDLIKFKNDYSRVVTIKTIFKTDHSIILKELPGTYQVNMFVTK